MKKLLFYLTKYKNYTLFFIIVNKFYTKYIIKIIYLNLISYNALYEQVE